MKTPLFDSLIEDLKSNMYDNSKIKAIVDKHFDANGPELCDELVKISLCEYNETH